MRPHRPLSAAEGVAEVARLMKAGNGLDLLLAQMPAGSTRSDALKLRRKLMQLRRTPSAVLDDELGIVRDRPQS